MRRQLPTMHIGRFATAEPGPGQSRARRAQAVGARLPGLGGGVRANRIAAVLGGEVIDVLLQGHRVGPCTSRQLHGRMAGPVAERHLGFSTPTPAPT